MNDPGESGTKANSTISTIDFSPLNRKIGLKERLHRVGRTSLKTRGLIFVGLLAYMMMFLYSGFYDFVGIFTVALIVFGFAVISPYVIIANTIRLNEFAEKNGFKYRESIGYDGREGVVFESGTQGSFSSVIACDNLGISEIGNFHCRDAGGILRSGLQIGYVRIKLPRNVPHIILDSKKNNFMRRFSNLEAEFGKLNRLKLEGDFNDYFEVYVPEKYHQDALYIFTPDLMQILKNHASKYDCEMIGSSLYFYSKHTFKMTDEEVYKCFFNIKDYVLPKFMKQTLYYADERVNNRDKDVISKSGSRMRQSDLKWYILTGLAVIAILFMYILLLMVKLKKMELFNLTRFAINHWPGFNCVDFLGIIEVKYFYAF